MRCATARRFLSDKLDAALRPGREVPLEAHLRGCPACRDYGAGLARIQAQGRLAAGRTAGEWSDFERALGARLDAAGSGRRRAPGPSAVRARWAWAAAAAVLLVAAAAWYALRRPAGPGEALTAYDDVFAPLVAAADSDEELAGRVDREVGVLIDELTPAPDAEAVVLPAAEPLFWEGLSDDDLRGIITQLELESGRGGPA